MAARTLRETERIDKEVDRLTALYGPYLTSEQFAEVVHIGRTTAVQWRRDGIGPKPTKVGRRYLYSSQRVAEYLAR